ncbi:MAG: hypothetical protein ABEH61_02085 [Haloarculaceae archaeon]
MGTDLDIFREEDLILNQIDQVGRLDKERELDRLLNVINDILFEHSSFQTDEIEPTYNQIKNKLKEEYYRTEMTGLGPTEMKVWHLSVFSSIELLQKLLINKGFESPDQISQEFEDILEDHFESQLERFSQKYNIRDLNKRLREPEVHLQENRQVLYWYSLEQEQQEFVKKTTNSGWETESKSGSKQLEVEM